MSFRTPPPRMAFPPPYPQQPGAAAPLTDGQWHRLHPATPLLRGGLAFVVLVGIVINNGRDWLINAFLPGPHAHDPGDPVSYVVEHHAVGWILLGILLLVMVLVGLFWLSWRAHEFRVTGEVVEVRSGVLFRNHRKARLDRIQGINIVRPIFPRLFRTARLEISQAGNGATVRLEYLGSAAADDLRARLLALASGARADMPGGGRASAGFVQDRVNDFTLPELDPAAVRATRVVRVHQGRLIGSLVLSTTTIVLLVLVALIVFSVVATGRYFLVATLLPTVIGFGGYSVRKFTKFLQYTIAETPDGIRIGYGLISTMNETLPPGRIHAVSVTQPILWRPFGWWDVRINRAAHTREGRQNQQVSSLVLPVGSAADVRAVLEIILPELVGATVAGPGASFDAMRAGSAEAVSVIDASLATTGDVGGFTRSPGRGAWLRPLSWRRNGYRQVPGAVVLRLGAIWRSLVLVPLPRVQSLHVAQGPVHRLLRLAEVHVHTVHGPVDARIGALDAADAMRLWTDTEALAIEAAAADRTQRWREHEADPEQRAVADRWPAAPERRPVADDWSNVPEPRAPGAPPRATAGPLTTALVPPQPDRSGGAS
ncbi:PH domain-containing protein [Curtobacterium ammoniigenes]|uniref:PH domain-containing protein n=1 Tax=Curtobacterium ammoniigenes TaxID=395387 RepID=UPI0008328C8B|nr:PH domain-containing protein [Curtobacterium ammoniigenes]